MMVAARLPYAVVCQGRRWEGAAASEQRPGLWLGAAAAVQLQASWLAEEAFEQLLALWLVEEAAAELPVGRVWRWLP